MPIFATKARKSYYVCRGRSNKCTKYTWNPDRDRYVRIQGIVYRSTLERLLRMGRLVRITRPPKRPIIRRKRRRKR